LLRRGLPGHFEKPIEHSDCLDIPSKMVRKAMENGANFLG
jgi:hypothetical protein